MEVSYLIQVLLISSKKFDLFYPLKKLEDYRDILSQFVNTPEPRLDEAKVFNLAGEFVGYISRDGNFWERDRVLEQAANHGVIPNWRLHQEQVQEVLERYELTSV